MIKKENLNKEELLDKAGKFALKIFGYILLALIIVFSLFYLIFFAIRLALALAPLAVILFLIYVGFKQFKKKIINDYKKENNKE